MTEVSPSRSANMSAIRSKDTKPELKVRRAAHAMGLRFRLHRRDLPGSPDLVFPKYRLAMFVHGCFWHGHGCKRGGSGPKTNTSYWGPKIERTQTRDIRAKAELKELGWRVAVLWECELGSDEVLSSLIQKAIAEPAQLNRCSPYHEGTNR